MTFNARFAYDPDAPPSSPSAYNDEFNGGAIGSQWSVGAITGRSHTVENRGLKFTFTAATSGGNGWFSQSLPGSGDWTAVCKIQHPTYQFGTGTTDFYMQVAETAIDTARLVYLTIRDASWGVFTEAVALTNMGSWTRIETQTYLKVNKTGTTLTWSISFNGKSWYQVNQSTIAFTPTKIGITAVGSRTTTPIEPFFVDWFRLFTGADPLYYGNFR